MNERVIQRCRFTSPIGVISIVANQAAIVAILWDETADLAAGQAHNPVERRIGDEFVDVEAGVNPVLDAAVIQLNEYFAGVRHDFDLPLAPAGTDFQQTAWEALRAIPYGETVSYGQQAVTIGDKNKARAVGAANGQNPIPIVIPCHRVVGSNGALTGFAGGVGVKRWLLEHERLTLIRGSVS